MKQLKSMGRIVWIALLIGSALGLAFVLVPSKEKLITIAFYNVENLFDTEDDPRKSDNEFLPGNSYDWTEKKLQKKLQNLAKVINQLGDDDGPELLGLAEVENLEVLERLTNEPLLKKHKYGIVHHESPDPRGIDVALLYKKREFSPLYTKNYPITFPENKDIKTRDILLVKGIYKKTYELTIIINHWPSRRNGAKETSFKRERAAKTLRQKLDSIFRRDPFAKIVILGDFNDEPYSKSLQYDLKAAKSPFEAEKTHLFNPLYLPKQKNENLGSLKFKSEWNLFDQILISSYLLDPKASFRYQPESCSIYNPEWLTVKSGTNRGKPLRSFLNTEFQENGFSDHFPVYAHFILK